MQQYKVFVFAIQVFLALQSAHAGFERTAQPSSSFGRGSAGNALLNPDNCWNNPASLPQLHTLFATTFYSPSPFQLPQLSNYGMIVAVPMKAVNIAIGFSSFGFSLYRESAGTVSISNMLTDEWSVGMNMHLYHLFIENYGSATSEVFDVGSVYSLSEQINVGVSLLNLTGSSFGADDDIPRMIATGISMSLSQNFTVNADLEKDIRYPVSYHVGIEFNPHELIILRTGTRSDTSQLFGGIGINVAPLQINYGVASHPELGLTHSIGIAFQQ